MALYWVSLALAVGPTQPRIVRGTFVLVGVFATVAVVWRAVDVLFFVRASSGGSVPLDLYTRHNYLPYFALLGAGVVARILAIYLNTRGPANAANRVPIFRDFTLSCAYLAVCRFVWELIDYLGRANRPAP